MTGEFQSILYRQDRNDPHVFFYVPGDPGPELTGGSPAASMVATGSGGFLQLGVHWDVSQAQLNQMQDYLRHQFPELDAPPELRPESLAVDAVNLAMQMADGTTNLLGTARSSGFPPFTALFNLSLDAARFAQAGSALRGREKVLTVSYQISGRSTLSCTATISGDVRPDVEELDPTADIAACLAQIESALKAGRLKMEISGDKVSDDLRARTTSFAKDRAAGVLQRMLASSNTDLDTDTAHLLASATLNEIRPLKLVREADVGRWFSAAKAATILVAGSSSSATSSAGTVDRSYKMGFDPKDLPIAYVQVSSGNSKQAFKPPAFSPVTVAVASNKPVTITTNYTDGGPPYQTTADDPILTPKHLGFCLVSVDGSGRKREGAKRIKLQVNYIPDRNGSEDQHTTQWAFGDWTDSWYVTSRDSSLAGVIEYSWQETAADGTVTDHPAVKTKETEIKI